LEYTWTDIFDLLLGPFYFIFALFAGSIIKSRHIRKKPYYRFFVPALACKLIGGVSLCLIYTFYYTEGGDSVNYFLAAKTYVNALLDFNFPVFFDMINFRSHNIQQTGYYENNYGVIFFNPRDYYALTTVVLSIPACILGLGTYIPATIVLDFFSFLGLWKLYEVFVDNFPMLTRQFAWAIFFVPSVFFWGSGILKDTYALSSLAVATYCVYRYLIRKQRKFKYLAGLLVSSLLLILVKPYILVAMLPGAFIWIFFHRLQNIRNPFFRTMFLPLILAFSGVIIAAALQYLGAYLGEYSLDNILEKAVKTQQDLVSNQGYSSNKYDIGKFDATITGVLSKAPAALNLALFRPYLWDATNPVMYLSGIENLFMLGFSVYILLRVKFSVLVKSLFSDPLLVFSFLFAIFFAFSVGLTTANYGALVRLKIPCIPFYISSLFILYHLNMESFRSRRQRWLPARQTPPVTQAAGG
jgi:hypothetical protein